MATIKSYTSLEQSKKLADILPTESADMRYAPFGDTHPWFWDGHLLEKGAIPCWSLASLFNYLREVDLFPETDADEFAVTMNINYYDEAAGSLLVPIHNIKVKAESFIDACYEMILKLNEQKLL